MQKRWLQQITEAIIVLLFSDICIGYFMQKNISWKIYKFINALPINIKNIPSNKHFHLQFV